MKGAEMRRAILFSAGMVVAGAALVLAASAAASGVRPGDGAAIRVASTDTMVAAVRPDDRAGIRGPGQLAPVGLSLGIRTRAPLRSHAVEGVAHELTRGAWLQVHD